MRLSKTVLSLLYLIVLQGPLFAESYVWPLDAPPALTSTYAEYRSGRFHAGLDVKTWGKEGYTCVAVADGYVWRVRTSPWGYGKAVYLKLDDGRTAVYAHLSGFVETIERVVAEEQDRRGAYSVNLYLPPGQIRVRQGDPIAFSGSTGSGYPHLHFEIRDANQRPLNPLLNGFGVEDTIAPTLVDVAFIPLDADARVDGRNVVAHRPLTWEAGKGWVGRPVTLWGRVGVSVKVFDRADASALTNKLAPHTLALTVDGRALFSTSYDAFSYTQVYEVDLDRSFLLTRQGKRGFHNLYVARGNTLPLYDGLPVGSGILVAGEGEEMAGSVLRPGRHALGVAAEDAVGNVAQATVEVIVKKPRSILEVAVEDVKRGRVLAGRVERSQPAPLLIESSPDGEGDWQWIKTVKVSGDRFSVVLPKSDSFYRVQFDGGPALICGIGTSNGEAGTESLATDSQLRMGRTIVTVTSSVPLLRPPTVSSSPRLDLDVMSISATHHEVVVPARAGRVTLRVAAEDVAGTVHDTTLVLRTDFVPPSGGTLSSDDGMAFAVFGEQSIYRSIGGRIERADLPKDVSSAVGAAYRFEPGTVPFREMVGVHLKIPEGADTDRLGVYELTDKGWSFVWNDVDSVRQTVWAGVRHFSTYGLLRDDVPPEVSITSPRDGSRVSPEVPFEVALKDSLSGIPMEELIAFTLDGKTLIFEYDPEGDVAKGLPRAPLGPGPHELVVDVRDTSGNRTVVTSRFEVTP